MSAAGRAEGCCVRLYNALALIRPREGAGAQTLDLSLHPARVVKGIVIGPDGRLLTGVRATGLTAMYDEEPLGGAVFTVTALNPRRTRSLTFRHPGKPLRQTLTIRGDEPGPIIVRFDH